MGELLDLLVDTRSPAGLAVTCAAILLVALFLRLVLVPLVRRRHPDDAYRRYWAGKVVGYAITALAVVALIVVVAPLGGRLSVILGFATAGVAFAMQEVIGALFGWVNILAGRIYTVGDRIEVGGVRGDVMDITPLRTTLLEIGGERASSADGSSVTARQPTGRVVTVSNKKTFTEAVFNSSAHVDWIWEELAFAVGQDADWRRAEAIVLEEVRAYEPDLRARGEGVLAPARRALPRLASRRRAAHVRPRGVRRRGNRRALRRRRADGARRSRQRDSSRAGALPAGGVAARVHDVRRGRARAVPSPRVRVGGVAERFEDLPSIEAIRVEAMA